MSGTTIWWRRAKQDSIYQFKIIRSVFDWTIIVYLLIPLLAFMGITYYSWWNSIPEWLEGIPYKVFFIACFLLGWHGVIRTFMEEADQLSLIQFPKVIGSIRNIGVIYSWSLILLKWLFIFIWLYPLLHHYPEITSIQLYGTILFFFCLNLFLTTYKQFIYRYGLLKRLIMHVIVFTLIVVLSTIIVIKPMVLLPFWVSILLFCIALWQVRLYQPRIKTFYDDVEKEQRNKVKYIGFMFAVNPEIMMPKAKKQKKRSWIFWRHSTRIFTQRSPENAVTELFIKSFLRDKTNLFSYLQILSITTAFIVTTPIWIKWLMFLAFYFFFREWIVLLFKEIVKQNPYLSSDYGKKDYMFIAQKKCENRFVYPGVAYILVITIMATLFSIVF